MIGLSAYDLDGTLLKVNCSYTFSQYLYKKGVFTLKDRLYCLAIILRYKYLGMDLTDLHSQVFDVLFQGRPLKMFEELVPDFLDHYLDKMINQDVLDILNKDKNADKHVLLLSSSPEFLVGPIANQLGIDTWQATVYGVDKEGCLCNILRLVNGKEKARLLAEYAKSLNISQDQIAAYSDSIDDLPFLQASGHPICVYPDRKLKYAAQQMGWKIIF